MNGNNQLSVAAEHIENRGSWDTQDGAASHEDHTTEISTLEN